jgi:putative restriction endonuclease
MKAVCTTKVEPTYDDLPEERYHFPRTYLRQIEAAIGDWIIYYEPRRVSSNLSSRGGRQSYFATARLQRIERDPTLDDHFYAFMSDYLEFDNPVPFKEADFYYEDILRRPDGATSKGAFGRAVRNISDHEYDVILKAGFVQTLVDTAPKSHDSTNPSLNFDEEPSEFERPVVEKIVTRPFREVAFATSVKATYANTCAMTGLQIINGGGRAEVQAAHIRAVASGGSDSVRNGLALSGTIHWMFDRGLVSIDDDLSILVAADRLPKTIVQLLRPDRKLGIPKRPEAGPHLTHVRYHREKIFKG